MSQEPKTKEQEQRDNLNGCLFLIAAFVILAGIGAVWGAIFGDDDGGGSSGNSDTPTVTMRGDILVYDQSTCARGPMVKVSAGARGPQPSEFSPGNAPCRLVFTMQVPANATQYKVQVENLPARIFYPDQMRNSKGEFEVKMTVYGD